MHKLRKKRLVKNNQFLYMKCKYLIKMLVIVYWFDKYSVYNMILIPHVIFKINKYNFQVHVLISPVAANA